MLIYLCFSFDLGETPMNFLVLYRNQYKNLKKDKRKKTRIFQIFFLLVLGIWGIHGTEAEYTYREAFYNRIKGLSDNAEQFDSSHYYYQRLSPPLESRRSNFDRNSVIKCFLTTQSGEEILFTNTSTSPNRFQEKNDRVVIDTSADIIKVMLDKKEVDIKRFRENSVWKLMLPASFGSLADLKEKVSAGTVYGYQEKTWNDESTGLTFVANNYKNIKILSMAICFSEEERNTYVYYDVYDKESNSSCSVFRGDIIDVHYEDSSVNAFPKDVYVVKNEPKISKLKKQGKIREIFRAQTGLNVRSSWIENDTFEKRIVSNGVVRYISVQLPNQYYGDVSYMDDLDFKGLLIGTEFTEGQHFVINKSLTSSYSKDHVYKNSRGELFFIKLNKFIAKYTDNSDIDAKGLGAEKDVEYLVKNRPLVGAIQTASHNIEGFYSGIQNWNIMQDRANPTSSFCANFTRLECNIENATDEEASFVEFLNQWDSVNHIDLKIRNFTIDIENFNSFLEKIIGINKKVISLDLSNMLINSIVVEQRIVGLKSPTRILVSENRTNSACVTFFSHLKKFKQIEKLILNGLNMMYGYRPNNGWGVYHGGSRYLSYERFVPIIWEARWDGEDHNNKLYTEMVEYLKQLPKLKVLKIEHPTYEMIKDNADLVKYLKKLKLCIHHTPENQKEAIKSTLSGGQGEVTFENDLLPPSSGCVIS